MIVGIDLGTTNSLVGVWQDGEARLIPNAHGSYLTPSAVSIDDNGEVLVGIAARERVTSHPQRSAAAFKRYMGTDRRLFLAEREFRPEELSALVLRSLKADAEAYLGQPVCEAVITVPAYFNDIQRKATRAAGELAGLKVQNLLNEPTAAALAYGLQEQMRQSKFLVFDLGGGTFDVSVLELFEGIIEVRATAGDNFLGGEDFVDAILGWFEKTAKTDLPQRDSDSLTYAILRRQAELAMRRLTDRETTTIELPGQEPRLSANLTRDTFNDIAQPLLARLRQPLERALRDARIRPSELSHVVLAGGATRMPMVRRLAGLLLGRPPMQHVNPDEVVARGAAVQAGLKMRDQALKEVVLTDVAPYSLGIEVVTPLGDGRWAQGQYLPIIERNTVIPTSRTKVVSPISDNQSLLLVEVYQGESRRTADNIRLGDLEISVPAGPAGYEEVEVRFTYDVDGLLEVEATALSTRERRQIVIKGNTGAMTEEDIAKRLAGLASLKIPPREQAENRALLARAERLFEEMLRDSREAVRWEILAFEAALESQEPSQIPGAYSRLQKFLDKVEHEFQL
jgi:molecular chaperone HscC